MFPGEKADLDAVCRRLREGRKVCVEVAHFFKLRSKAEYEYTKSLLNCSKTMVLKDDLSSPFNGWWRELKMQTVETANAHNEAADHYNCLADELLVFSEEQAKLAHITEENIKRGNAIEKVEFRKALIYRSYYQEKRKLHAAAAETHGIMKRFVTTPKKDLDKAKSKAEGLWKEREAAGNAYDKAVARFVGFCKMWEPRMEKAFKDLEDLELNRLRTLRNKMWKSTNIDSLTAVIHDECCEAIRQRLEQNDIFINFHAFGRKRRSLSQTSDSSASPAAHSTPKPHRPWNTLQHRRNNFTIDEHGYATAYAPTDSENGSNADETDMDQTFLCSSESSVNTVHEVAGNSVFNDCGYATVKDVERQADTEMVDSQQVAKDNPIHDRNGEIPVSEAHTQSVQRATGTIAAGNDNECMQEIPDDLSTFTAEDVQIWKDNFGYASVKDIRRRKHTAQKESGNNSQRSKDMKHDANNAATDEPQEIAFETKDTNLPCSADGSTSRTTWL